MKIIAILIIIFIIWIILRFIRYLAKDNLYKNEIYSHININGLSTREAFKKSLSTLNKLENIGLSDSTIYKVSMTLALLQRKMNRDNVIDIYSSFSGLVCQDQF